MLTKEECLKAHYELSNILVETDYIDGRAFCTYTIMEDELGTMYQLIEEHFELVDKYNELEKQHMKLLSQWGKSDNPPLKLEELEDGEWYWCEEYGWCLMNFYEDLDGKIHFEANTVMNDKIDLSFDFEENRFYRKQVKDDG